MTARVTALGLLGGLLVLHSGGSAQERGSQPPPKGPLAVAQPAPKPVRAHHPVHHADPVALAEVLGLHFKGEADVLAAPAGSGNALLVSGSPAAVEEVTKLIAQLDRKPRTVEVEIVIAEVSPLKAADGKEAPETDVSGPDPLAKLDALIKGGKVGGVQRIKLTAVEGQPVTSTTGGNKPYVSSTAIAGGRGGFGGPGGAAGGGPLMQRSVNYHPVGTTVKLTARVGDAGAVGVDLNLQDSKVRPPEPAEEGGPGGAGAAGVGAATFETGNLTTRLSVPAGKSVVAQAVRTEGKGTATVALVVVGARVVEPAAGKGQ